MSDPRGPLRRVVSVEYGVTLECGHQPDFNPAMSFKVGEKHNCFKCKKELNEFACCEQARKVFCVCAYAFMCDKHGQTHVGTHD